MVGFAVRGRYFFLNEKNEKERAKRKCDTEMADFALEISKKKKKECHIFCVLIKCF